MTSSDAPASSAASHQLGHRKRLRQRFLDGGAAALPDYELLELLLCLAIPQRDVKPLAKDLLARFGSFADVVHAGLPALLAVPGIKDNAATALKLVAAAATRLAQVEVVGKPVLTSWDKLVDYCQIAFAHQPQERFHLLFLDRKNVLIADETQQKGTIDHTPAYPREVVKRALELNASAIILVHNHPSGDPTPSQADIDMTRRVEDAVTPIGIVLHDHLVIGRQGSFSFRSHGLI
ncbi:RadC family protein [Telmatospirillum sp.]|uniref:RadC family protein n=1 Tax=Telmatospirillum sp. TaxID=2079197 RepID=UPI00284E62B7|nr:DNA repair protein RadC [Telmatospirillum sp.]MDR3437973.1 DNA repair protein RadC [Telmatospirillum sp.]